MFNFNYETVARTYDVIKQSMIKYDKKVVELFECILDSGVKRCLEVGKVEYNQEDPDSLPTYTFRFDIKKKISLVPENSNGFVYEEIKKYLREKFEAIAENNGNVAIITPNHIRTWTTEVGISKGIKVEYCESEILEGYRVVLTFTPDKFNLKYNKKQEETF